MNRLWETSVAGTVPDHELLRLSTKIVAAHVAHNDLPVDGLPALIRSVYAALSRAVAIKPAAPVLPLREPAVPIKKSVFPGYLVCLEDGRKLKLLRRHLLVSYGLTPDKYRARWKLPSTYPMVAPDYAANRSKLSRQSGLGRKVIVPAAAVVEEPAVAVTRFPARTRGRPPKAKSAASVPDANAKPAA